MTTAPDTTDYRLPDTLQGIYDAVARHLLAQGAVSVATLPHGGIGCAYRGDNGLKCAIGALIPDELYYPEMEGMGGLAVLSSIRLLDFNKHDREWVAARADLLIALQRAHDDAHGVLPRRVLPFWEQRLASIAETFGLRPFTRAMLETCDASTPRA